jgi:Phytanoyl-CoA dioxygenase (PhyH)
VIDSALRDLRRRRPRSQLEVTVSAREIDAFWEEGFLALGRITTDEEIEWLRLVTDALFANRLAGVRGGYFDLARPYDSEGPDQVPQVLQPEKLVPELGETALARNGRALAAALLGADAARLEAWGHMIVKPARFGGELPWHQDEAYWHPGFDYHAVGVWVPLDPATPESGCLSFLPGSHRGDVRAHAHIGGDPSVHGLVALHVDDAAAVSLPVAPGGAAVHHCRTLHRSAPNKSAHVRRACATEYRLAPTRRAVPAERPWLVESARAWARRFQV